MVGSVAYDAVEIDGVLRTGLGGSAVYAALAAAQRVPVDLYAVVGLDFLELDREFIVSRGINIDNLRTVEQPTLRWRARYVDHTRAITEEVSLGAILCSNQIPVPDAELLLLCNYDPETQLRLLRKSGFGFVACDTMDFWIKNKAEELTRLFHEVDLIFINEDEVKLYTGRDSALEGARLLSYHFNTAVVLKRGPRGSVLVMDKTVYECPAHQCVVLDTTGAGDAFAGGFMAHLAKAEELNKATLQEALYRGAFAAHFAVSGYGVAGFLQ